MLWFMHKPNEKLLRFVIILLWEVIYAHFYNWNSPLDWVLIVYDLIELIIEVSLWSKDFSTFDIHTQNTQVYCSMNAYFICVIVDVQMWCVYSIACWSNPERFLSILYVFENVFTLSCCELLFILHFSIFLKKKKKKTSFKGIFTRSSQVSSSHENEIGKNENIKILR